MTFTKFSRLKEFTRGGRNRNWIIAICVRPSATDDNWPMYSFSLHDSEYRSEARSKQQLCCSLCYCLLLLLLVSFVFYLLSINIEWSTRRRRKSNPPRRTTWRECSLPTTSILVNGEQEMEDSNLSRSVPLCRWRNKHFVVDTQRGERASIPFQLHQSSFFFFFSCAGATVLFKDHSRRVKLNQCLSFSVYRSVLIIAG